MKLALVKWERELSPFGDEQIKTAFERCGEKPPNLKEFVRHCTTDPDWHHNNAAYRPYRKALPPPTANKSVARDGIDECRARIEAAQAPGGAELRDEVLAADNEWFASQGYPRDDSKLETWKQKADRSQKQRGKENHG